MKKILTGLLLLASVSGFSQVRILRALGDGYTKTQVDSVAATRISSARLINGLSLATGNINLGFVDLIGIISTSQLPGTITSNTSGNAASLSAPLSHALLPTLISGDIPNNAANTSGSAGTLSAPLSHSLLPTLLVADIPALDASKITTGTLTLNTSGTAANVLSTTVFPNGVTATTQSTSDSSKKVATTEGLKQATIRADHISGVIPSSNIPTKSLQLGKSLVTNATGDSLALAPAGNDYDFLYKLNNDSLATPGSDSLKWIAGKGLQFKGNLVAFGSGSNDLLVTDQYSQQLIRSLRSSSGWTDLATPMGRFEIGQTASNIYVSGLSNTIAPRMAFGTQKFQISKALIQNTSPPVRDFEMINSSGARTFGIASDGRIDIHTYTVTSPTTLAVLSDTVNAVLVTALANSVTISAPTGTPYPNQLLTYRFKDNGTAQTLTWNTIFRNPQGLPIPATTTANNTLYVDYKYNAVDSKWDIVATNAGTAAPSSPYTHLVAYAAGVNSTGTTTETTVYTTTIAANPLNVNGSFTINYLMTSTATAAGTKIVKVKINGTIVSQSSLTNSSGSQSVTAQNTIYNNGSTTSQVSMYTYSSASNGLASTTTSAPSTFTIDETNTMTVTVTITNVNTTDATTVNGFQIMANN